MYLNGLRNQISDSSLNDLPNNKTKDSLYYPFKKLDPNSRINEIVVFSRLSRSGFSVWYHDLGNYPMDQHFQGFPEITEWLKTQPLSILQLDAADRIVLFIAGM